MTNIPIEHISPEELETIINIPINVKLSQFNERTLFPICKHNPIVNVTSCVTKLGLLAIQIVYSDGTIETHLKDLK